ncbi:nematoblast specific protein [Chitinophaga caeni]|uniref:Nematoblast specific protein n=1 Tax=Chitinophaga caeni TaxID=2029983 RepID=A0A291QVN1_9BACT|nr:DUF5077 domain-containing protein [Chitinophaga caeni]ATL47990.1 nematoblast specific protein [Chitinophaga caeni]
MKQLLFFMFGIAMLLSCQKNQAILDAGSAGQLSNLDASVMSATSTEIPLYGNAYFTYKASGAYEVITSSNGLANWTSASTITSIDVAVPYAGNLDLKLILKVAPDGNNSVIKVTVDGVSQNVAISGGTFHEVTVGSFSISSPKTVRIDFQGVSKTGGYYADLSHIIVDGSAMNGSSGPSYEVALAGNAFITTLPGGASELIGSNGLANWTNGGAIASAYVRVNDTGKLSLSLRAKVAPSGNSSVVKVTVNGTSQNLNMSGSSYQDYYVGEFDIDTPGYVRVDLQGVSKTGSYFGDVSHIIVGGSAVANGVVYSDDPDYYYWARRGPSCHLGYTLPTSSDVSYYYCELEVPSGQDPIGSYFMADGFSQGYFGMQVNSASERRILFSVWSPYSTDDPSSIPEDYKITLNRKGTGVTVGEFGNEGAGGQSYLVYNWSSATTYKFLLKGVPDGTGKTDFTAWFYAPSPGSWQLIASFKRPYTNTYLKGFHSFLENFSPDNGYHGRTANYKNQWVYTAAGSWMKVNAAKFTVDGTYSANQRIDAMGGTNSYGYFLQNGGFFNTIVAPNTVLNYTNTASAPVINFSTLP